MSFGKSIHPSSFSPNLLSALIALLVFGVSYAQTNVDAEGAANLQPVVITATPIEEEATGPVYGYKATQSATTTRTETPLQEVPRAIGVVAKEQVQDQQPSSLDGALRYSAGVTSDPFGAFGVGDYFEMRGGTRGALLSNGGKVVASNFRDAVRVDPFIAERIEVLRGPSSVIVGQSAPGGAVNVVSKRPQVVSSRSVGVELGSFDHKQIHADLTGSLVQDGQWTYRLVALAKNGGTQVDHTSDDRILVAPSVQWNYQPESYLWLYGQYQKDDTNELAGFFPSIGTQTAFQGKKVPSNRFISEPGWDKYKGDLQRIGYEWKHTVNNRLRVRSSLRRDETGVDINGMYAAYPFGLSPAGDVNRIWYITEEDSNTTDFSLQVDGDVYSSSGNWRHTLMARLDSSHYKANRKRFGGFLNLRDVALATPLNVFNPVYGQWQLPADARTRWFREGQSGKLSTKGYGITLQDQAKFKDKWVVNGSVRYDKATLKTETVRDANGKPVQITNDKVTKNIGVVYLANNGFAPYYSYSESFEPQLPDNSGVVFKPKTGRQHEFGLKWLSDNKQVGVTVAYYKLKEQGRLRDAGLGRKVQMQASVVEGFEIDAQANLRNWDLIGQLSLADSVDNETNLKLQGVPEENLSVWAVYKFNDWAPGLRAGLGVRHTGRRLSKSNQAGVPSVTLADAMVSWQRGPWNVALNVTNLMDEKYLAACGDALIPSTPGQCFFGERRKVKLSLNYAF